MVPNLSLIKRKIMKMERNDSENFHVGMRCDRVMVNKPHFLKFNTKRTPSGN